MSNANDPTWERKVLERLAFESLAEQKRRRRWGILFKLLGLVYLTVLMLQFVDWDDSAKKLADGKKHTAVVELSGIIASNTEASAENIIEALQHAFKESTTQGVILRINSPGGSPVQSGMINDEIRRLRAKYKNIPLYAVVEDTCASGGYYVATAADKIYVDKASLVGSIGVLMDGFGFTGTMDKLGVERRLLTAGENKGFLDPFSPQEPTQRAHAKLLLDDIHKQFIDAVRNGRGTRLKETSEIFSGLMWTGPQAIELGLADGYGSVQYVAREVVKAEDLRDYTVKQNLAERLARRLGTDMAESISNAFSGARIR
jgi:protease-4